MAAPKTYLEDPVFEDQIAPRSWLSAFYIFCNSSSAAPALRRRFVEQLRQNLDETIQSAPRFGAELEEQPDGRIRLVKGSTGNNPNLLQEWSSQLSIDELVKIIEQPGAAQTLQLPDPVCTTSVEVLTIQSGVCVVFRQHHSLADGATFAIFTRSVAQGEPFSPPVTVQPPPPTTADPSFSYFKALDPETCFTALRDSYHYLQDKGGPAQPEEPHRSYAGPTESRTYRVSKTKCKKRISENPLLVARGNCSVFEYLAAMFAAHALTARLDVATKGASWGNTAIIWIAVDVRLLLAGGGHHGGGRCSGKRGRARRRQHRAPGLPARGLRARRRGPGPGGRVPDPVDLGCGPARQDAGLPRLAGRLCRKNNRGGRAEPGRRVQRRGPLLATR